MWEAISNVLTSNNIIPIGIILILVILTMAILARMGLVSFHGKGVSVGNGDKEREIIRHQIDYAEGACTDFFIRVERKPSFEEWRAKYIMERAYDVLVRIISYNHIQVEDTYIELRQSEIWKTIQEHKLPSDDPYYSSDEFKKLIYNEVKGVIEKLVKIREFYSK
jgi:hypothetical protein